MSAQVESGTETFSVQAGNRLALSASTQAEINARTARLSSEGRMVVNVNTSMPQAFSMGVTAWRNDVVIVWQASLDSPLYQNYLYTQAKSLYQSGQYTKALGLFNKLNGYSDSRFMASQCNDRINEQNQARYKAAQEAAQLRNAVGADPLGTEDDRIKYNFVLVFTIIGAILVLYCLSQGNLSDAGNMGILLVTLGLTILGAIYLIRIRNKKAKYEEKVADYRQSKK